MQQLEPKFAAWRRALNPAITEAAAEELESHLRAVVDEQIAAGKSPDEAFTLAVQRLGNPADVSREFAKARSQTWLPVKLALVAVVIISLALGIIVLNITETRGLLLAAHTFAISVGYLSGLLVGGLGICFALQRWLGQTSLAIEASATRGAALLAKLALVMTILGVLLGAIWAQGAWGRLWAWDGKETGGASVIFALAIFLACHNRPSTRAAMIQAIIGNIIISLAWFAPAKSFVILTALLLIHAVGLVVAALPARSKAFAN